ncbi:hypothetical protein ABZZ16_34600, partial [Streptomyces sp. NPDC006386]
MTAVRLARAATGRDKIVVPHHGVRPRFMAQPPLMPAAPYELERADGAYSAVEIAIRRGLGQDGH